jgi:hypothetical protein
VRCSGCMHVEIVRDASGILGENARTRRSWGLVGASRGVIGCLAVILSPMFRCRRPEHAFVRHLVIPSVILDTWIANFDCYYIYRRIPPLAHQVEHFLLPSSFEASIHQPSINQHILPYHLLPSIHQATTTYLVYVPATCHLPITITRGAASILPAKTPIGPQPHSSCDLHGALPSLARDLTRHTPPS